jgi:hypothetical protein
MPFCSLNGKNDVMRLFDFVTHMFCVCVLWCFVRRALSPSSEGQGLVNESKNSLGIPNVNWFFQRGEKKLFAPCHLVTGKRFCFAGCHHSGEVIKIDLTGI